MTTTLRSTVFSLITIMFLGGTPALAAPDTIDFGGSPTGNLSGVTAEDGFNYDEFSGNIAVTAPGNPAPDLSTTAGTPVSVLRIVSTTPGELFNFDGLDFAENIFGAGQGSSDIIAVGFLLGVSQGSQTFMPIADTDTGAGIGPYSTGAVAGALLDTSIDELRVTINGAGSGFFSNTGRVDNIVLDKMISSPPPIPSDFDGDGDVDQDDLNVVVNCFGQLVADNPACAIADVAPPPNGDGVINILDISFVGSNFTP